MRWTEGKIAQVQPMSSKALANLWKKVKQWVQQVHQKTQVTRPVQPVQQATWKERIKVHIAQVQKSHLTKNKPPGQGKQKTMGANNNQDNKQSGVELNPELHELKRQLFEGFEQMIEPLKWDIEDLKTDRDNRNAALNVETLSRKLKKKDEKHRKLESRLSQIEDQLLERNLIFQGIVETEFEDRSDIKIQVIKAITPTMDGEDEEEQKKMQETLQLKQ